MRANALSAYARVAHDDVNRGDVARRELSMQRRYSPAACAQGRSRTNSRRARLSRYYLLTLKSKCTG